MDSITAKFEEKNKDWHATSQDLIEALGEVGKEYATPAEFAQKLDLSFADAYTAVADPDTARKDIASNAANQAQAKGFFLKGLLVEHIKSLDAQIEAHKDDHAISPRYDAALASTMNSKNWRWLGKRGWSVEDLMSWTWILKASNADLAAARFWMIASKKLGGVGWHVPNTIFLFLLRRQHFSAKGLRYLLKYAWKVMEHMSNMWSGLRESASDGERGPAFTNSIQNIPHPEEHPVGMREEMFIMMIIRLLRRARDVLPEACEGIVSLFCRYLNGSNFHKTSADPARLSFAYNTMLSLLAVPFSYRPFINSAHQQRAQFAVLHRMNEFQPALVVDRRGYRAVTRVQLKHRKTLREREWAMVKSPSWPPWKVGKLGIHKDITPEYGFSRASQSLRDAQSAGYGHDSWAESASVLAGWDTDGTPTIQSRRDLNWHRAGIEPQSGSAKLWANRIRATRSPREGWALFQQGKNEPGWVPNKSRDLYRAMFEKIVWVTKMKHLKGNHVPSNLDQADILPGDGPELSPDPHINAVSVSVPMPDFAAFYKMMLQDGVKPQTDLLSYLLSQAPSLTTLIKILKDSEQPLGTIDALIGIKDCLNLEEHRARIIAVPRREFEAVILAMARLSKQPTSKNADTSEDREHGGKIESKPAMLLDPFSHALHLMCIRKLQHPKAWIALLDATARRLPSAEKHESVEINNRTQTLNAWQTTMEILSHIERFGIPSQIEIVNEVSKALEWAVIKSAQILELENTQDLARRRLATNIVDKGLSILKTLFVDTVGTDIRQREVPDDLLGLANSVDCEVENELHVEPEKSDLEVEPPEVSFEVTGEPEPEIEDESSEFNIGSSFLPPDCLLPRLLAVPHPALLHRFIRICGLTRDYQALIDILDWMAIFSVELNSRADEQRNGPEMMRRCIVAARVFLERSWVYYDIPERHKHVLLERDVEPAPRDTWEMAKEIVKENPTWGEWPKDHEVEQYVYNGTFI